MTVTIVVAAWGHSTMIDERQALSECIADVQNNCKGIFDYAVLLEEENARLNRECK